MGSQSAGNQFTPKLIIYQIIAMQCFYYLAMGGIYGIFHFIFGSPISLDHYFTTR